MKNTLKKLPSLSERALLVSVSLSQWGARKLDASATETVSKTYKTDSTAGGYTKRLLPGADELSAISTISMQIRKYFYAQTLPWMSDGSRIIKAENHLKFSQEFRKMKNEFDRAVHAFVVAYPNLQAKAQNSLGSLYRPSEYPDASKILEKFKCEVNFLPLPDVKDFRVAVSDAEKRAFVNKMHETEKAATREVWSRLHEVVKNAAEKLAKPEAIFRDSLLENVKELCSMLPALNISDDPELEGARKSVEKLVTDIGSADSIRNDKNKRQDAAKALKDVQDKMSAFSGLS